MTFMISPQDLEPIARPAQMLQMQPGDVLARCDDVKIEKTGGPLSDGFRVWVDGAELHRLRKVVLTLEMDHVAVLDLTMIP